MLIDNSKKIVLKLGSSTVVDRSGKFKKKWGFVSENFWPFPFSATFDATPGISYEAKSAYFFNKL